MAPERITPEEWVDRFFRVSDDEKHAIAKSVLDAVWESDLLERAEKAEATNSEMAVDIHATQFRLNAAEATLARVKKRCRSEVAMNRRPYDDHNAGRVAMAEVVLAIVGGDTDDTT